MHRHENAPILVDARVKALSVTARFAGNVGDKTREVYGSLSLVNVVCWLENVSVTGRSFIQWSSSECVQHCLLFLSDFTQNRKLLTNFR